MLIQQQMFGYGQEAVERAGTARDNTNSFDSWMWCTLRYLQACHQSEDTMFRTTKTELVQGVRT